jgi:hypothetical protein
LRCSDLYRHHQEAGRSEREFDNAAHLALSEFYACLSRCLDIRAAISSNG